MATTKTVIICGLSGAGTSTALKAFEDSGFFTVGRIPVRILSKHFEELKSKRYSNAPTAILPDIKSEEAVQTFLKFRDSLPKDSFEVLFLDAKNESLIKRYSETRRPHPSFNPSLDQTISDTIQRERSLLIRIKEIADKIIDSSDLTVHDLKRQIDKYSIESQETEKGFRINFVSFGFKYGAPVDCDLIIDVRFLPNPHFIDELRNLTGKDKKIQEWVLEKPETKEFLRLYVELLNFLLPKYQHEGKSYLNIGIGCTGGKHRSVTLAEKLKESLGYPESLRSVQHRDINR